MPRPAPAPDPTFDALVVGAGPAGSLAARVLARAGLRVGLVDKQAFPRPKVCGDALIPDSLRELAEEGLLERVAALGHPTTGVRVFVPSGRSVRLAADCLTIERRRLDALLVDAAVEAGATLLAGTRVSGPLRDAAGAVAGALAYREGEELALTAPLTILASGAAAAMLKAFGVGSRPTPSALALRAYYALPWLPPEDLIVSFEKPVMPGYGWIFPMGGERANVGCGVVLAPGEPTPNLARLFEQFLTRCEPIRELLRDARPLGSVKGAPLRCALEGASPVADGLLVAGEALGTTYALTGEGIGKAMASGRIAARAALAAHARGRFDAAALADYPRALEAARFPELHAHYRAAEAWMGRPWAANLMAWRAARSPRVRGLLEAMLREEALPSQVLSAGGLLRALLR